ncbi:hypothetical protein ZWY2020_051947 [Hordeum vulgare]|nr:hypothetical protein ZWY2020_051947 [Hordeum vulgare]
MFLWLCRMEAGRKRRCGPTEPVGGGGEAATVDVPLDNMGDSNGKARELSSWESDLMRREAVGFALLFALKLYCGWLGCVLSHGVCSVTPGYQKEGGIAQECISRGALLLTELQRKHDYVL